MSRLGTITRRTFLVGAVALAGGVAYGTYRVARTPENPLDPEDGIALNPWVILDESGVTVIAPRAEMGQGVQTTLAALVAEELEYPLEDIRIEHGPPAEAYVNQALMIGRGYDDVRPSGVALTLMQGVPKLINMQITGGSSTTIDAFDKMRLAGAAAREVMLRAGAEHFGLGLDQLHAEAGAIVTTDGRSVAYTDLVERARAIPAPPEPVLKRPEEWTVLGRSQRRLDQPGKATGTATFGIDVRLPDMRFASVRMSPRLGGTMESFDAAAAEAMPGVERVVDLGTGIGVIASNTWLAMRAAEAVEITWGPAPYPETTEAVFAKIAEAFDGDALVTGHDHGDVEATTASLTAEYRAPYLAHATMEPMNATALLEDGHLTVWSGNQAPITTRNGVADALGIGAEDVTLHTTIMGGGFGRRAQTDFSVHAARLAAAMPGTPVQCTWTREEDMRHDYYRPGAIARMTGHVEDGRPVLFTADIASRSLMIETLEQMGMSLPFTPPDSLMIEGAGDQPYAVPNIRVRGFNADVSIPVGSWRSVGNSQNAFFHESFMDEMAHAAGADPFTFRHDAIADTHPETAAVLARVAEISDWGAPLPANRARGIAVTHSFGTPVAEVVEVEDQDGTIRLTRMWIAADPGVVLDPANVEAQLISGAIYGLSAAIHGQITFADGEVQQGNFYDYDALRLHNVPVFDVALLSSGDRPRGIGEPGTPPAAPALANALFALTGTRARSLPLQDRFSFLI